jgi:hypothetical protein
MMPRAYVKRYLRRQKNDAADAAAICEAVTRPSMRFVAVRSLENQATLMRHKTREMRTKDSRQSGPADASCACARTGPRITAFLTRSAPARWR